MNKILSFLVLSCPLIVGPQSTEAYRILGVFPFHGKSHFTMFEALMKGLARKGHQVDVISPFPQKKPYPNYTDIIRVDPQQPQVINNMSFDLFQHLQNDMTYFIATDMGNKICERLGDPEMVKLIQNPPTDPPYDLVMTEIFGAHCYIAFGHHLKAPTIALSSAALYPWANGIIANPPNLAFVPNNLINYVAPMTFWQRLCNTVHAICSDLTFQYYSAPQTAIMRKYFGSDTPDIRTIERTVALILANSHPTLNGPRPVTTGLVEVGGLHIQDDGTQLPLVKYSRPPFFLFSLSNGLNNWVTGAEVINRTTFCSITIDPNSTQQSCFVSHQLGLNNCELDPSETHFFFTNDDGATEYNHLLD